MNPPPMYNGVLGSFEVEQEQPTAYRPLSDAPDRVQTANENRLANVIY